MTLTTGDLHLKGASGNNYSIAFEVDGQDFVGSASLINMSNNADPAVGSLPTGMRDFSGHTQSWGRAYSVQGISDTPHLERIEEGSYNYGPFTGTIDLQFTGDRDEYVIVNKNAVQGAYIAGDGVDLRVYRRAKQTAGSWGTPDTGAIEEHVPYDSTIQVLCTFSSYDYLFDIGDDPSNWGYT